MAPKPPRGIGFGKPQVTSRAAEPFEELSKLDTVKLAQVFQRRSIVIVPAHPATVAFLNNHARPGLSTKVNVTRTDASTESKAETIDHRLTSFVEKITGTSTRITEFKTRPGDTLPAWHIDNGTAVTFLLPLKGAGTDYVNHDTSLFSRKQTIRTGNVAVPKVAGKIESVPANAMVFFAGDLLEHKKIKPLVHRPPPDAAPDRTIAIARFGLGSLFHDD